MRKLFLFVAVFALLVVFPVNLHAGTLANVTLPDSVQAGGKTLVLNGMGLRSKMMFKVYVGGLYLEQKSADASAIIKADAPKRVVMHFMRDVSKNQMTDAYKEGFENNAPDAMKTMKGEIDRFLAALEAIKEGQEMSVTYVPGTGTTLTINGQEKLTIAGPGFAQALFSVWLGPKPPNESLKKGLLGQS